MTRPRTIASFLSTLCVGFLLICAPARAQKVYEGSQQGLPPFGSFQGSNFDLVTLQNGNLHIEIPVLSVAQRGRTFSYRYTYDTRVFTIYWVPNDSNPRQGLWTVDSGLLNDAEWRLLTSWSHAASYEIQCKVCGTTSYCVKKNWQIRDPSGTKHQVGLKQLSIPTFCEGSYPTVGPTTDGSGMTLDVSSGWDQTPKVRLKDGTEFVMGTLKDSNGNVASSNADMLGRNLVVAVNGPQVPYLSPLGRTRFGPQYTTWTVKDSDGIDRVWQVDYEAVDIQTSVCGVPPIPAGGPCYEEGGIAVLRPSKVILPTAKFYRFYWQNNGHGEITRVDLPTGGYITYTYTTRKWRAPYGESKDPYHARRAIASRTVNPGGTWIYIGNSVTDPAGNEEVRTMNYLSPCSGATLPSSTRYETEVKFYQGSSATGTLLRTITKDYAFEAAPSDTFIRCDSNVRVIRETTTLNDTNQASKVETDFETFNFTYS